MGNQVEHGSIRWEGSVAILMPPRQAPVVNRGLKVILFRCLLSRNLLRLVRQRIGQMRQHLFRADLQKVDPLGRPIRKDARGVAAAGFCGVTLDQAAKLAFPITAGLSIGRVSDQFVIRF